MISQSTVGGAPGWRISSAFLRTSGKRKRCAWSKTTARRQRFWKLPTASLRVMPVVWVKTSGRRVSAATLSAYMPGLMSKMKPGTSLSRPRSGPVTATPVALSQFCIDRMLNRESLRKHCCARVFPTGFTVASVFTSAWKFATPLPTSVWLRPATMTPH